MKLNSKYKLLCLSIIITGILTIEINISLQKLNNIGKINYENISSIRSNPLDQSTTTCYEWTPYGSFIASGNVQDEYSYLEWNITTLYGPGFTWYMMNDTEFWDFTDLKSIWRTRGNFSYTALLSDEEESASGVFYPQYTDQWWLVSVNHYTGVSCSAMFTHYWKEDFIHIFEPTSSSLWGVNTSHYINWTWGGDFNFVDIDLYYNDSFSINIAKNAQNNGSYLWRIPNSILRYDDLYQINISNSDYSETWDISDAYYKIEPKIINLINPVNSSSWDTKGTYLIIWSSTGPIKNVNIKLFKNDTYELEINSSTPNDGIYYWSIPDSLENSTQYQIKIIDVSDSYIYNFSENFEIYTSPPAPLKSINIIVPNSVNSWKTNEIYLITWTSTGFIDNVKIELFKNNIFELEIISNTLNDGNFSWIIPAGLEKSTQYQIKITDLSNSSIYDYSEYFEIYTESSVQNDIPGFNLWILLFVSIIILVGIAVLIFKKNMKLFNPN